MKKFLSLIMTFTLILSLVACGGKDDAPDEGQQSVPTGIANQETEFHKTLVPVKYREEEEVQSTYYKTVFQDDEAYYEVQPDGEEDVLRIPISETVKYGVEDGENYVEKVMLTLDDGQTVEQYQLYVQLESGAIYVSGTEFTPADNAAPIDEGREVTILEKAPRTDGDINQ